MLNTVLIGYGYWGPNIARNLNKSDEYNLVGICDLDETKLAKARLIYGDKVKYFTDWNEALDVPGLCVAAVALRNDAAQNVSCAAMKKGLHLFIEKPFATNMQDALSLKEISEQNRVRIHVDHLMIYNPFIRRIKQMIEYGELGDMVSFESLRSNLGPHIKKDMNAMWDLAVHDIAVLDYLCNGKVPTAVHCVGQRQFGKQEIVTYITLKYAKFSAMIKSSWFSPRKERMMIISGTKKMVIFDDIAESEKLLVYDKGVDVADERFKEYGELESKTRIGDVHVPYIEFEDSLLNSLTHFADCINDNRESSSNPDTAIRVLDILLKADKELELLQ